MAYARRTKVTKRNLKRFLEALSEHGIVSAACRDLNIRRELVYRKRSEDPEFAKAWEAAIDVSTERLEREAYRRAHDGTDEPVYQNGNLCGFKKKFSDTLMIFLLKKRNPEYRDKQTIEHTGPGGGAVQVRHMTDDELDERILSITLSSAVSPSGEAGGTGGPADGESDQEGEE